MSLNIAVPSTPDEFQLHTEVVVAYGATCQCCGIQKYNLLTIRQSKQGPAENKQKIYRCGKRLWKFLKNNNYPKDGYELLCFNCNFATRRGCVCPHKQSKTHGRV